MHRLSSQEVYRNAWRSVREDQIERDDGSRGIYGVVHKPDFSLIVPEQDGGFWLVEQYRYPVDRRAWEFPQGPWSPGDNGEAADLARAELAEETGLRAGRLQHLGHLYEAYGFCSQGFDVYLATDLKEGLTAREASEQDMTQQLVTEAQLRAMIAAGDLVDGATLAAYTLYLLSHDRR